MLGNHRDKRGIRILTHVAPGAHSIIAFVAQKFK
jgi:hypothetical protein